MEKIDNRTIYERLWTGRDFEIKHLWQRSVFLATFIVMIFTAYCGLWAALIGMDGNDECKDIHIEYRETFLESSRTYDISDSKSEGVLSRLSSHMTISCGFLILSFTGSVFSLLWIFMAKGSKYWYEKYESSINHMHDEYDMFTNDVANGIRLEELNALVEWRHENQVPIQGHLQMHSKHQSIYSREGAAYSMSKVNVTIGQVFFILWNIAFIGHFIIMAKPYMKGFAWLLPIPSILLWWGITCFLKRWVSGGEYEKHKPFKANVASVYKDKRKKEKQYRKKLVDYYHDNILTLSGKWTGDECFDYERKKLDNVTDKYLDYDDKYKLELFLREYSAPDYFPLGDKSEWKDSYTGGNITFPMDVDTMCKVIYGEKKNKCKYSLHSYADLSCIPLFNDKDEVVDISERNMTCILVDDYGHVRWAIRFHYKKIMEYLDTIEYEVICGSGAIVRHGKLTKI